MRFRMLRLPVIGLGVVLLLILGIGLVGDARYQAPLLFDATLAPEQASSLTIAPLDQALTFARFGDPARPQIALVHRYTNGSLEVTDLNAALSSNVSDPLQLFNQVGYRAIQEAGSIDRARLQLAVDQLLIPFDAPSRHIAAGTNYPEHGEEVGIDSPFLFPKLGAVTHFASPVSRQQALLDYEAELGMVLLQDQPVDAGLPATLGFVLLNDFTDRDLLVRRINLFDMRSGAGFTDAKSREGFVPIGNLLVIPADWRSFFQQIDFSLYVNGQLRQQSSASAMIWQPEQIMREIAARRDWDFPYQGQQVRLLPENGIIPQGTIIMTGTPEGVVFRPPTVRQIMAGIPGYLLSFNWWQRSPLDAYIAGAHNSGAFLQPGDQVLIRAEGLGVLHNQIVP